LLTNTGKTVMTLAAGWGVQIFIGYRRKGKKPWVLLRVRRFKNRPESTKVNHRTRF
jgi:hypothetical protein